MAYEESIRSITLNADASLGIFTGVPGALGSPTDNAQKQYHLVKVTGAHQCGLAGATDAAIGVLQNKPQGTGHAATVAIRGVSKIVAAEAIAAGAKVYANASGQVQDTTTTNTYVGIALAATAAAGELVPVLLKL